MNRDWDMIGGAGLTIGRPIVYHPLFGDPKDGDCYPDGWIDDQDFGV